jgi:putative DNA primase/helicase
LTPDKAQQIVSVIPPTSKNKAENNRFLDIGLKRDRVFNALWSGERRHGNESADDIALMNKLAYWCNADTNAMIQAFISSPYYAQKDEAHKKKCQRSDYLPKTAKNSCDTVRSTAIVDYERYQKEHQYGKAR